MEYTKFIDNFPIHAGDTLFISSDVTNFYLYFLRKEKVKVDWNILIDSILAKLGPEGTLIFPTYNWGFCHGEPFDYNRTKCLTGLLGTIALKRHDFKRTLHPIYSFAVAGKYQSELCVMNNKSSFGEDSPFAFLRKVHAKNLILDVGLCDCFTFTHYVEQSSGIVKYRFEKNFTSTYIDARGILEERTYSMFVRYYELDVQSTRDGALKTLKDELISTNVMRKYIYDDFFCFFIDDMARAYEIIMDDIINNRSRKICTYIGQ